MVFMEVLKSVAEGLEMLLSQKMSSKEKGEPPTLLFELLDGNYVRKRLLKAVTNRCAD